MFIYVHCVDNDDASMMKPIMYQLCANNAHAFTDVHGDE
jgi:hypothetical protein